jgi:hypothetical protein
MASEGANHSDWYTPIAQRVQGSQEFQRIQAELIYYSTVQTQSNNSGSEPVSLQLLALEAFRKQVFIKEWLLANEQSLLVDKDFVRDYTIFEKADFILNATVGQLCEFIRINFGVHLTRSRYGFIKF